MTGPAPRVVGPRGATAEEVAEAPSVELLMNGTSRKRCRAPSFGVLGIRYCRRGQRVNNIVRTDGPVRPCEAPRALAFQAGPRAVALHPVVCGTRLTIQPSASWANGSSQPAGPAKLFYHHEDQEVRP